MTIWNEAHANITISNAGRTLTKTATNWVSARADTEIKGKVYWEYVYTSTPNVPYAGFGKSSVSLSTYLGSTSDAWCKYYSESMNGLSNTVVNYPPPPHPVSGIVLGIAVDSNAGKVWFAGDNVWFSSGDPATGANAIFSNVPASGLFPMITLYDNNSTITANWATEDLVYSPPAGFNTIDIVYEISGTLNNDAKIYVLNETNHTLESVNTKDSGEYSIIVSDNSPKSIVARRTSDSSSTSFCNVTPVLQAP